MPVWSQFVDLIQWGLGHLANNIGSAGLAVIVFTILFKTLLLPLTIKSVRSMSSMQELQPKIKELQKKYGKDRQKLSAETMKLYQEHGVNPASGCLPMILQMPIFFGLYFAIRHLSQSGAGVWGNGFLWLPSLAKADPYHILPILAGVFQFIQTKMARPAHQAKIDDPQQQMMNSMMMFMPLMVVVFGWPFAAGPVIYWVVSAIYSAVQQWFITGWGSMLDWFPFLPDLPEHRRLGYEAPEKRAARRAKAGGEQKGFFGLLNRQIQQQVEKVEVQRSEGDGAEDDAEQAGRSATPTSTPAPATPATTPGLTPRRSGRTKRR